MNKRLFEMVLGRLEDSGLVETERQLVIAACRGEDSLVGLLQSGTIAGERASSDAGAKKPGLRGAFLLEISVRISREARGDGLSGLWRRSAGRLASRQSSSII